MKSVSFSRYIISFWEMMVILLVGGGLIFFAPESKANPFPMPPQVLCNGQWVPQGTCQTFNNGAYGMVPVNAGHVRVSGLSGCQMAGGLIGGGIGYMSSSPKDRGVATLVLAVLGAIAGNAYCSQSAEAVPAPQQVQPTQQAEDIAVARAVEKRTENPNGCGVRVGGILIKEFSSSSGNTCDEDRKAFVTKYLAQCHGKKGSLQKDVECGRSIQ